MADEKDIAEIAEIAEALQTSSREEVKATLRQLTDDALAALRSLRDPRNNELLQVKGVQAANPPRHET
jgi:hypothetical protein